MREMKDSGIDWIGEIPRDWNITKVGRIGKYINGYAFKPTDWSNNGLPIIRIQNLSNSSKEMNFYENDLDEKYHIYKGDYLISWSATLDIFKWQKEEALLNQHIFKAIPNEEVMDYNYFYWIAKMFMIEMSNDKHGSAMQHVTGGIFNGFRIPIQTIKEQQSIADYLDNKCAEIDSLIEKTKATINEYKKLKQSVITEAVTKGLNPNVEMKDSGIEWIGKVPKHWKIVKIQRLFEIFDERNFDENATLLSLYTAIGVKPRSELEEKGNKASTVINYKIVKKGDLIVNKLLAWMGAVAYSDYDGVTSPDYDVYREKKNANVYRNYYNSYFRYTKFKDDCYKYGHGIMLMRWRTYPYELMRILVPNPPFNEQQQIGDYLSQKCAEIDTLISKKQTIVAELESYKKSLIYECVTGKREVVAPQSSEAVVLAPLVYIDEARRLRAQAALMTKALDAGHTKKKFGRTEWFKNLYLLDACVGFPLKSAYIREEYGPILATNKECENIIFRQNKWFTKLNQTPIKYVPTQNKDNYISEYESFFSSVSNEIEEMLKKLNPLSMNEIEKIATLYAVWNDFILDGKNYSDNDIVNDVLSNWSNRKGNFSRENWHNTLEQMRKLDIVPKGYGMHTVRR